MNANANPTKRRLLAALLALGALVVLIGAMARSRPAQPTAQSQPRVAVVKLPGGGQRTVLLQPAHATTQSSPGGQTQVVSAVTANGTPVLVSATAGGGDR